MFYLRFNFDFYVFKIIECTYELGIFHANQTTKYLRNQAELRKRVDRLQTS